MDFRIYKALVLDDVSLSVKMFTYSQIFCVLSWDFGLVGFSSHQIYMPLLLPKEHFRLDWIIVILLILRNRKSARCGIVKGSVLPNLVYRLNNPNWNPSLLFFLGVNKLILKFVWRGERPEQPEQCWRKTKSGEWGYQTPEVSRSLNCHVF